MVQALLNRGATVLAVDEEGKAGLAVVFPSEFAIQYRQIHVLHFWEKFA